MIAADGAKVADGGKDLTASVMISLGIVEGSPFTAAVTTAEGTAVGTRSFTAEILIEVGAAVDTLSCTELVNAEVGAMLAVAGGNDRMASVMNSDGILVGMLATAEITASVGTAVGTLSWTAAVRMALGAVVGRLSFTASVNTDVGAAVAAGGILRIDAVMYSVGTLDGALKTADTAESEGIMVGILSKTA